MQLDYEKLEKLYDQLQKMNALLGKITDEKMVYINIEKLDVHGPVLDSLDFIFDKIDVKEVSGALNIGNNLGVTVEGKKENNNIKPSGVKAKAKTEQVNKQPKPHPGSKEAAKKYAELEKKLEKKLDQVFLKGPKSNKNPGERKPFDQPSRTVTSPIPEKELKQPGQLRKIVINREIIINPDT